MPSTRSSTLSAPTGPGWPSSSSDGRQRGPGGSAGRGSHAAEARIFTGAGDRRRPRIRPGPRRAPGSLWSGSVHRLRHPDCRRPSWGCPHRHWPDWSNRSSGSCSPRRTNFRLVAAGRSLPTSSPTPKGMSGDLLALHASMVDQLEQRGRLAWAIEECAQAPARTTA